MTMPSYKRGMNVLTKPAKVIQAQECERTLKAAGRTV